MVLGWAKSWLSGWMHSPLQTLELATSLEGAGREGIYIWNRLWSLLCLPRGRGRAYLLIYNQLSVGTCQSFSWMSCWKDVTRLKFCQHFRAASLESLQGTQKRAVGRRIDFHRLRFDLGCQWLGCSFVHFIRNLHCECQPLSVQDFIFFDYWLGISVQKMRRGKQIMTSDLREERCPAKYLKKLLLNHRLMEKKTTPVPKIQLSKTNLANLGENAINFRKPSAFCQVPRSFLNHRNSGFLRLGKSHCLCIHLDYQEVTKEC